MGEILNELPGGTIIRVEARKSFQFGLWIKDFNGRSLDVTGATVRLVVKQPRKRTSDDSDNLITNSLAEDFYPTMGYLRFNLQASDLDLKAGEYPYSIVMWEGGYSSVLVKGTFVVLENTEFDSVNETYMSPTSATALQVLLRGRNVIAVRTGPTLAPGTTSFTDGDKEKLDSIQPGAEVNVNADWEAAEGTDAFIRNKPEFGSAAYVDIDEVSLPRGGFPGEILVKITGGDFAAAWQQPTGGSGGGSGSGLDPTGIPDGYVPMANGVNGWTWEAIVAGVESVNGQSGDVTLTMDDIADTATRVAMEPAERAKLADVQVNPEWSTLTNVPAFGTAALMQEEDVLTPGNVTTADVSSGVFPNTRIPKLTQLRGFSSGTGAPSGGSDGDLYFQYTE